MSRRKPSCSFQSPSARMCYPLQHLDSAFPIPRRLPFIEHHFQTEKRCSSDGTLLLIYFMVMDDDIPHIFLSPEVDLLVYHITICAQKKITPVTLKKQGLQCYNRRRRPLSPQRGRPAQGSTVDPTRAFKSPRLSFMQQRKETT